MAGAEPIVAVDVDDDKLAMAQSFGATHTINASAVDATEAVRNLTPGPDKAYGFRGAKIAGVDFAFDVVAKPETFLAAFRATRNGRNAVHGGGTTVMVGVPSERFELPAVEMLIHEHGWLGPSAVHRFPTRTFPSTSTGIAKDTSTLMPWSPRGSGWTRSPRRPTASVKATLWGERS